MASTITHIDHRTRSGNTAGAGSRSELVEAAGGVGAGDSVGSGDSVVGVRPIDAPAAARATSTPSAR